MVEENRENAAGLDLMLLTGLDVDFGGVAELIA